MSRLRKSPSRSVLLSIAAAAALLSASILSAADKTNYQDNVLPIFRNNCLNCHNPDKKKAGLDLSTYSTALSGSNNGPVINSGDPDGSLLYKVVTHAEDPSMPPKKDKLPDKELDVIKSWIAAGALETATGKPAVSSKPKIDLSVAGGAMKKPDGPPLMPRDLLPEPVVRADRPWAVRCMAASPWSPVVAIGGQHQILLYNTNTLDLLGIIPFTDGEPQVVQFSRSGKLLLVGGGVAAKSGKVSLWDLTSGQKLTDVGEEFDSVLAADLSPDQTTVCLGGPTKVFKVYSTRDGSLVHVMKKHTDWVTACAYSPDGVLMASADRAGGLWVWESKTGNEFYNLAGHKAAVTSVAFRDDSNFLASASEDGTVKLWDMQSGKEVKSWQAHGGGVLSIAFTHDGRLVTSGRDRVVKTWKSDGGQIRQFDAFNDIALHATFDSEGKRVVAGDWTGDIRVWDAGDGKMIGHLSSNPAPLVERIAAAEKRVVDLQVPADKAHADAASAQAAADKAVADQKNADAALASAKQSVETSKTALKSADDAMHAAEGMRKGDDAAVIEIESAVARATQSRERANSRRDDSQRGMKPLEQAAASRQKDLESARQTAQAAEAEAIKSPDDEKLKEAAAEKKSAVDKAEKDLASAQSAVKDRADQLKKIADEVATAESDLSRAQDALESVRKSKAEHVAALEKLKAGRNEADAALAKSNAAVATAEKALAPMAEQVKNAQANAAKLKAPADEAARQISAARIEVARLKVSQFYMGVYTARQELAGKQSELDQLANATKAAQAEIDGDTAAIAAGQKSMSESGPRLQQEQASIAKAKEAVGPLQAADQTAQAVLAQKQALLTESNALATKLWVEAPKTPDDKKLAEAANNAKAANEALTVVVDAAKQIATTKAEALKNASAAVASAEQTLAKDKADLETMPKRIEGWKQAIATAQSENEKRKPLVEQAAKAVQGAKGRVDQLTAEYQKKSQEAGLSAQASAQGK